MRNVSTFKVASPGTSRPATAGGRNTSDDTSGSTTAARRSSRGFTLIEVLITVAIVAIIAAVALPSYSEYVMRSKIVEATSGLSDMRVRLEQYFLDLRQYPGSCIAAASGPAPAGKIYLPSGTKYFTVTCALTANTFTVTATGTASGGMSGFVYTIDEANNRRTTGLPSGWTGTGNACWVTKKSGEC